MMPDCKLDVTGAPVIGFSAWLARPVFCVPKTNLKIVLVS